MNIKDKIIRYFNESVAEFRKVAWPTKPEIIGSTIIVIISSLMVSIFIFLVDMGLSETINFLLRQ